MHTYYESIANIDAVVCMRHINWVTHFVSRYRSLALFERMRSMKFTSMKRDDSMTMEQDASVRCRKELISLIEHIDASYDAETLERLRLILYGQGGYDQDTVHRARKNMHPKLLLKLDSFERSAYCGPRDMRRF